jgi:hypothetical protein
VNNVNKGTRWQDGSLNSVDVTLNNTIFSLSEISQVVLQTTFRGGSGGDNWNLNAIRIEGRTGATAVGNYYKRGDDDKVLHRFTEKKRTFTARR